MKKKLKDLLLSDEIIKDEIVLTNIKGGTTLTIEEALLESGWHHGNGGQK